MNKIIIVVTTVVVVAVVIVALTFRPAATTDTLLFEELEHRLKELEHQVAKLDAKIGDTEHATGIRKMQIKNEAGIDFVVPVKTNMHVTTDARAFLQ